jgi:hypothetical protein
MPDWLSDVIGNDLIAVYDGLYFTEDALLWLREKPRTFGELRAKEIDWLRWMAVNVQNKDLKVTPTGQSGVETLFTGKSEN